MKTKTDFQVVITETLERVITVSAYDSDDAVKAVHDSYHEGEISLSDNDLTEVSFKEY